MQNPVGLDQPFSEWIIKENLDFFYCKFYIYSKDTVKTHRTFQNKNPHTIPKFFLNFTDGSCSINPLCLI